MAQVKSGISDEELLKISSANPELRFELVDGELIAMPPTGGLSGSLGSGCLIEAGLWCRKNGGIVFDSSTGFRLPNRNVRSPDAAVLLPEHPHYSESRKMRTFIPAAPDFLIEVRSFSDSLAQVKDKMLEWIENGCSLAFLLDPIERKAFVYRKDRSITEFPYDARLSGEEVLPGFEICPASLDPQ